MNIIDLTKATTGGEVGAVDSVNGKTGDVVLTAKDLGINTATVNATGLVKPDGTTISITEDGTISSKGGDTKELQDQITAEVNTRTAADEALTKSIADETAARTRADENLTLLITTETDDRETADTTLQGNIDAETALREAADATLQDNIDKKQDELTAANAGNNITITKVEGMVKISSTGGAGAAVWGGITGDIANQEDLQTALDIKISATEKGIADGVATLDADSKIPLNQLKVIDDETATDTTTFSSNKINEEIATKATDADVVHITGNETISGVKTFTADILAGGLKITNPIAIISADDGTIIRNTTTGETVISNTNGSVSGLCLRPNGTDNSEGQVVIEKDGTITGNATSATKAEQDFEGNIITDTYAKANAVVHVTGDESIAGIKTFTDNVKIGSTENIASLGIVGNLSIQGNIVQNGQAYETHAEKVYTTNDYIILRDGAEAGLAAGEYSGFTMVKYDGENSGNLVIDSTGTARVGDVGNEQPLLTRSETADMSDGLPLVWNAEGAKAITSDVYPTKKYLQENYIDVQSNDQTIYGKKIFAQLLTANSIEIYPGGSGDAILSFGGNGNAIIQLGGMPVIKTTPNGATTVASCYSGNSIYLRPKGVDNANGQVEIANDGTVKATAFIGNITESTKATQDGEGNVITDTYATKAEAVDLSLSNLDEAGQNILSSAKAYPTTQIFNDLKLYNYVLDYLNSSDYTNTDVLKRKNYTVVGETVITDDGIATNFTKGNAIVSTVRAWSYIPKEQITVKGSFTWTAPAAYSESEPSTMLVPYVVGETERWRIDISRLNGTTSVFATSDVEGATKFTINIPDALPDDATFEITDNITKTGRAVQVVVNNKTYTGNAEYTNPIEFTERLNIAYGCASINADSDYIWNGSIDLNTLKVYADEEIDYQACLLIPYTMSTSGSKIVDAEYRTRVFDAYDQFGFADYYTIDKINKNVTLPMSEIYGTTNKIAQNGFPALTVNSGYTTAIDGHVADYFGVPYAEENSFTVNFKAGGEYPSLICTFIDGDTRVFNHVEPITLTKTSEDEAEEFNLFIDKHGKTYAISLTQSTFPNAGVESAEIRAEQGERGFICINTCQLPWKMSWVSPEGDEVVLDHLFPFCAASVTADGVQNFFTAGPETLYNTANIYNISGSPSMPINVIKSWHHVDGESGQLIMVRKESDGFAYRAGKVSIPAGKTITIDLNKFDLVNTEFISWIECDNPKVTIAVNDDGSAITLTNTDIANTQQTRWKLEGWE